MAEIWTDEEKNEAAKLWADGKSMTEIGTVYGRTKGSVSGMICRNRDLFPGRQAQTVKTVAKIVEKPKPVVEVVTEEPVAEPVEDISTWIVSPEEYDASRIRFAKSIAEGLRSNDCRWPVVDEPLHRFCCATAIPGSSYCPHHAKRARGHGTISERKAVAAAKWVASR